MLCKICHEENCKKHSFLIGKKVLNEFSGSSPPEIFVGKWNYPNVYAGILSPQEYGNTSIMSSVEEWHQKKLPIPEILRLRNQLIYSRTQNNIKHLQGKFHESFREVAMTSKPISAEFKLKKPISANQEKESRVPLISHAASLERVRLQENSSIKPKVDYLVNDDVKSAIAIQELYKSGIDNSSIIKILSAGLLGMRKNRKLVPTRWSITAVDDTLSKEKLKKIKTFPEIPNFEIHTAEYVGNHYEFLLLPEKWSFEVIEISLNSQGVWHDYESFFPRKQYADSVTGAYYANRLALTEYLEKIHKQCQCIVFRQVSPEYYAPLGVGILRQTSREAFSLQGKKFSTLKEALDDIQSRLKIPIPNWTDKSIILKNYGKQRKLSSFF